MESKNENVCVLPDIGDKLCKSESSLDVDILCPYCGKLKKVKDILIKRLRKRLLTWLPLVGGCFLLPNISIAHVEKRSLPWLLSEEVYHASKIFEKFKITTPQKSTFRGY